MHPSLMEQPAARPPEDARLQPWHGVIALVVVGMGAQIVGGIAAALALVFTSIDEGGSLFESVAQAELSFVVIGPALVFTGLTMAGGSVLIAHLARVPVRKALGIERAPWPTFLAAPIGILALGPTSDALRQFMAEIAPNLTLGTLEQLDGAVRSAPVWLVAPLFALVPGIAEELLFRGAFQRSIRTGWLAVLLSGVLFAAYHTDPHHVVAVLPLGLYLAWLGQRTGSVLVPITAHVANNAAAVLTVAFFGDAARLGASGLGETLTWMLVGWAIAAGAVAIVWRSTRPRA